MDGWMDGCLGFTSYTPWVKKGDYTLVHIFAKY